MPKQRVQPGPGNAAVKYTPSPSPCPCILGFLPSFLDLSLLLRTELCPADLFPSWSASFCCYQGLQICHRSSPHLKHGIISEVEVEALETSFSSANFLQIQDLGSQLLGCTLWAFARSVVQPVVIFWNPFHPGR